MTRGSQQARDVKVTEVKLKYIIDHRFAVRQQPHTKGGKWKLKLKVKAEACLYWKHHEQLETAIDKWFSAAAATSRAAGVRSPR
jgi:hypothetical protein